MSNAAVKQLEGLVTYVRQLEAVNERASKGENEAGRRADTAERLMREAQATAKEALASAAHFKNELDFAGQREGDLREQLEARRDEGLVAAVQNINAVAERTAELLIGTGSGIRAGMEVRRRMALKYSAEHDAEHGAVVFEDAAIALVQGESGLWPVGWKRSTFDQLIEHPQTVRAHAIALLAVAYDITRREQDSV